MWGSLCELPAGEAQARHGFSSGAGDPAWPDSSEGRLHRSLFLKGWGQMGNCQRRGDLSPSVWQPPEPALPGTHAAAGGDGDLDGVAARLAHMLQVQGLVGGLVVAALDGEGSGVDTDLHRGRPVGVHLPVLVVVALELQLQVGPAGGRAEGGAERG